MANPTIVILMAAQREQRRREEEERRKRKRREEQRKREEEARKKEEERHRKMIEQRKNSPVIYNDEDWQKKRCVKAFSMQPCVQDLVSIIDETRPKVIEIEEKKYDSKILEVGYEYELLRKSLDSDIEKLNDLGITINGRQYVLSRLAPIDTLIAKPVQTNESFGSTFTIMDGNSLELNQRILSNDRYYINRYQDTNPGKIKRELNEINLRMQKYHKFGKILKFLLKTKEYSMLERRFYDLNVAQERSELRKREMETFNSLTKEQLLIIKSYFEHLSQLSDIGNKIDNLFRGKAELRYDENITIFDLTIKYIMSSGNYNELLSQVYDYISNIMANDPETMKEAYELVKGEYPIEVSRRSILDLIISNMKDYNKSGNKQLKFR